MQGGGTPGGLGLDAEFFESALVPQIMLKGFLGFAPKADGFLLDPHLPKDWPELTVNHIRFQNLELEIRATHDQIRIQHHGQPLDPTFVYRRDTTQTLRSILLTNGIMELQLTSP